MLVAKLEQSKYFSVIIIEISTNLRQMCLMLVCDDHLFNMKIQFPIKVAVKAAVFVHNHQRYRS